MAHCWHHQLLLEVVSHRLHTVYVALCKLWLDYIFIQILCVLHYPCSYCFDVFACWSSVIEFMNLVQVDGYQAKVYMIWYDLVKVQCGPDWTCGILLYVFMSAVILWILSYMSPYLVSLYCLHNVLAIFITCMICRFRNVVLDEPMTKWYLSL